MSTAWLTKVRVKPWRLAYYRAAFLDARDTDPDLCMAGWIREACDEKAMRQFGERKLPSPDHLFFDQASQRRRSNDDDEGVTAASAEGFDESYEQKQK